MVGPQAVDVTGSPAHGFYQRRVPTDRPAGPLVDRYKGMVQSRTGKAVRSSHGPVQGHLSRPLIGQRIEHEIKRKFNARRRYPQDLVYFWRTCQNSLQLVEFSLPMLYNISLLRWYLCCTPSSLSENAASNGVSENVKYFRNLAGCLPGNGSIRIGLAPPSQWGGILEAK